MVKVARSGRKNEDFSESVCSFHSGAIFLSSLKQKLSNDALVVSFLSSERISLVRTGSGMTPGHDENFDFSRFCAEPFSSLPRKRERERERPTEGRKSSDEKKRQEARLNEEETSRGDGALLAIPRGNPGSRFTARLKVDASDGLYQTSRKVRFRIGLLL